MPFSPAYYDFNMARQQYENKPCLFELDVYTFCAGSQCHDNCAKRTPLLIFFELCRNQPEPTIFKAQSIPLWTRLPEHGTKSMGRMIISCALTVFRLLYNNGRDTLTNNIAILSLSDSAFDTSKIAACAQRWSWYKRNKKNIEMRSRYDAYIPTNVEGFW